MAEQKFHVAAKALIFNDKNEILVLKKRKRTQTPNPSHWDLPGRRIKTNQTLEEAFKEEIEEELGIKSSCIEIIKSFDTSISNLKIYTDEYNYELLLITFLCRFNKTKIDITLNHEHSEYKWATLKEAKKLLSTKFSPQFIKKLKQSNLAD